MTGHSIHSIDLETVWKPCHSCGEPTIGENERGEPECMGCFMVKIEGLSDAKENR